MNLLVSAIPVDQFPDDPLAIPVFSDVRPPHREAGRVDFRLAGQITDWIAKGAVDPESPSPTLFSPGEGKPFPILVIAGAGSFTELSAPAAERVVAALTETMLRAKTPLFALAARDLKRPLMPPRDSAEIILRGIAHGAELAERKDPAVIRIHWDQDEIPVLIQELRRFRHHVSSAREWVVEPAPEDEQLLAGV